ncbi:MAG: hypothetical protein E6I64_07055 [Chloroflexi bacterium]|nr:MAG: hypothetical protein E6I64_07055 [Chloroflexota bacterium]
MEKALWVVRDKITSPGAIDDLMADATTRGIHDVVAQVRGRGDAYFGSTLEPQAEALEDPAFDPLGHLVRAGAAVGVRVHAWANVFFVWSSPSGALPRSSEHLVRKHPAWLLPPDRGGLPPHPLTLSGEMGARTDRPSTFDRGGLPPHPLTLSGEMGARTDRPATLSYLDPVGGSDWEGIYTDPRNTEAREHTLAVFTDIVARYRVEGFHYDYVRYPQAAYASSPDDHTAVTALVREGATRLRSARPGIVISAAVFPDPDAARDRVLQRWPDWAREGWIDLLCPMAYRKDTSSVRALLTRARKAAPRTRMWGGLMAYAGERRLIRDQVRAAKDAGCDGAILFAYEPTQRDLLDVFAAS